MRKRIKLTESDLHRIVNESVKRVLIEGQGWNMFNNIRKRANDYDDDDWDDWNNDMSDPEYRKDNKKAMKNFIKYGDANNEGRPYYDEEGYATNYPGENNQNRRINRGYLGQLGRWAGANAGMGYVHARNAMNKAGRALRRGYDKVFK